jgi:nondiscriminating aspartyl-tRNA synthetase
VEIHRPKIEVLVAVQEPPPLELFRPTLKAQLPTILDHTPIALRHLRQRAIFKLSSAAMYGFRDTLRARHFEVMDLVVQILHGMFSAMEQEANAALSQLKVQLLALPEVVPILHFSEAFKLVSRETGEDIAPAIDLSGADERVLGAWALREHNSDFVFVQGYPTQQRAFYTHPDPERPGYSRGFDLIFRGLELVLGAQRLHRYDHYLAALAERGMSGKSFSAYLEAYRYGMPPHGGFAIGLERLLARLIEAPNIRETTLFPRDLTRLMP